MSLVTKFISLVKPEASEKFSRTLYNQNLDKMDAAIGAVPSLTGVTVPEGKRLRQFTGRIVSSNGAGAVKSATSATDANGIGALWFGDLGLPNFEGIGYISLTGVGSVFGQQFAATFDILDYDTTRVRFFARKIMDNIPATAYGSVDIMVNVVGW